MKKFKINWTDDSPDKEKQEKLKDIGLLMMRLSISTMMLFGHGFEKLVNFTDKAANFPDPLGIGSAGSLALVVFAEFFCSMAIAFGIFTRYAVVPLIMTMLVAAFVIHGDDPWGRKEIALIYLIPYVSLLFAGSGRYSLDRKLFGK